MKKILGFLAVAMLLGVIAPQTAYAEKKKDGVLQYIEVQQGDIKYRKK